MKVVVSLSLVSAILANPLSFRVGTVHNEVAPLLSSSNAKAIPNQYIIKFKDHVKHEDAKAHHLWIADLHNQHENRKFELRKRSQIPFLDDIFQGLKHTFDIGSFLGYSGHFDEAVIEELRRHPDIEYIEQDSEVHTLEPTIEKLAPWGLARISHRDQLSLGSYNKYVYTEEAGDGVDVYVIDTGTNVDHVDFEGRASWGKTIPSGDEDKDGNGHGTHCSGTIAGKKYGVAKKANIVAVKVLRSNGSGSMSDVVKGVEFAVEAHTSAIAAAKAGKRKGFKGSAANMSLGGGKSPTLDLAVNAAVDAGIHFAVAAGNDNADACNYSPAAAEKPITVGASTAFDERAYFSNYGKCTDIFAPGLNIQSTWIGSKYATNTISGTSMASPHIAGLLAYMISLQPSKDSAYAVADITPKKLKDSLIAISTKGALGDIPASTPNYLAWNGGGSNNYTDIIHKGGYKVSRAGAEVVEEPETVIEIPNIDEIRIVIESDAKNVAAKMEKFAHDMAEFMEHEIEEVFNL